MTNRFGIDVFARAPLNRLARAVEVALPRMVLYVCRTAGLTTKPEWFNSPIVFQPRIKMMTYLCSLEARQLLHKALKSTDYKIGQQLISEALHIFYQLSASDPQQVTVLSFFFIY